MARDHSVGRFVTSLASGKRTAAVELLWPTPSTLVARSSSG